MPCGPKAITGFPSRIAFTTKSGRSSSRLSGIADSMAMRRSPRLAAWRTLN